MRSPLAFAILTLATACSVEQQPAGQDETPAGAPFADPSRVNKLGRSWYTAAITVGDTLYVGTDHGLYRANAPDYQLAPIAGGQLNGRWIAAMVEHRDALYVAITAGNGLPAGVLRSEDGGDTWTSVSRGLEGINLGSNAEFASSADRLVFTGGVYLLELNPLDQSWISVDTGDLFLVVNKMAFDGDTLVVNDGYGQGVFEQLPGSPVFSHIDSLEDWGYTSFDFAGNRKVTANQNKIFTAEPGHDWVENVIDADEIAPAIAYDLFSRGDVILAAGEAALRRSTDGVHWTEMIAAPSTSSQSFAATDAGLFWIADELRFSTDLGASWAQNPSEVSVARGIAVGGGEVYATTANPYAGPDYGGGLVSAKAGEFANATMEHFGTVGATASDLWSCDGDDVCVHAPHGTREFTTLAAPVTGPIWYGQRLFTSSDDAFYTDITNACDGSGKAVTLYRAENDVWTPVGAGLPNEMLTTCYEPGNGLLYISALSEANGVLFAKIENSGTWRSADRGDSWTPVVADITQAAGCDDAIVGLGAGGLVRSVDGGATFSRLAPIEDAAALTTMNGQCVLGLRKFDGTPTLYASTDGLAFLPVGEFAEPIGALAGDDSTLAISTLTYGVYRAAAIR